MDELVKKWLTLIGLRNCKVGSLLNYGFGSNTAYKILELEANIGKPNELKEYEKYKIELEELQTINEKLFAVCEEMKTQALS